MNIEDTTIFNEEGILKMLESHEELCDIRYIWRWTCDVGSQEQISFWSNQIREILDALVVKGEIVCLLHGQSRYYGHLERLRGCGLKFRQ